MQVDQIEPRIFELDAVSATVRQLHSKVHIRMARHDVRTTIAIPADSILAARLNTTSNAKLQSSACLPAPQVERLEPRVDDADTVGEAQRQSDKALRQLHSKVCGPEPNAQRCCWPGKKPVKHSTKHRSEVPWCVTKMN